MKRVKLLDSGFKLKAGRYTAKQVLESVIQTIEEEPKRLHMRAWLGMVKGKFRESSDFYLPPPEQPSCGTAACVGGWIGLRTRDQHFDGEKALKVLGLPLAPTYDPNEREGVSEQIVASYELDQLFGNVYGTAHTIVPKLREFVAKFDTLLTKKKVTVPTREAMRQQQRGVRV